MPSKQEMVNQRKELIPDKQNWFNQKVRKCYLIN
jgi:hypothetical protein